MGDRQNREDDNKLFVFTGGFLRQRRIRRILALSGFSLKLGIPKTHDSIAVWGRNQRSKRGRRVAQKTGAGVVTVEDAFLRSVQTGRSGEPPLGLVIDSKGAYFDCTTASDLEDLLNYADLNDPNLLTRARAGIDFLKRYHLSKYNAFDPEGRVPFKKYVLVIDQTRGDASIEFGGANEETFRQMLKAARAENPDKTIVIKTHPEVIAGHRKGHFAAPDLDENMHLIGENLSPWTMFKDAASVYCVSSLMGFEAILAGHRVNLFGKPFYAGWGLSHDRQRVARRHRKLSREELFAATSLLYPRWYDPHRDQLCEFEDVARILQSRARAWREDQRGYVALGMRLWKRRHLNRFFGVKGKAVRFASAPINADGRKIMVWAGKETAVTKSACEQMSLDLLRVEDGFLRSRGLGAELVPPLSLVLDDIGIYYDPNRESSLEIHIIEAAHLPDHALQRAANLRQSLTKSGISKYNLQNSTGMPDIPKGKRVILVPGQVEDDASILLGTGDTRTNIALLKKTRSKNPDAFVIFKPHPDVEAGLRKGAVEPSKALNFADTIAKNADAIALISACDAVWTMTSLLGFETLLRGKSVTCLGAPFYSGWGLTNDFGPPVPRRKARPTLDALIHATLIKYPRYFDPITGTACPVEVVVERLKTGSQIKPGTRNRMLAKLQGIFASFAPIWR